MSAWWLCCSVFHGWLIVPKFPTCLLCDPVDKAWTVASKVVHFFIIPRFIFIFPVALFCVKPIYANYIHKLSNHSVYTLKQCTFGKYQLSFTIQIQACKVYLYIFYSFFTTCLHKCNTHSMHWHVGILKLTFWIIYQIDYKNVLMDENLLLHARSEFEIEGIFLRTQALLLL